MKFRTEINISTSRKTIEHKNKIATIGSCFAENIGHLLHSYRFEILDNPFGVLYNPASVYNSINLLRANKKFTKKNLILFDGEWHSLFHHSTFSHHKSEECLNKINQQLENTKLFFAECKHLIFTYGTAFIYKYKNSDIIVSNCHKIPANQFERSILSVSEIEFYLNKTIQLIAEINPNVHLIWSVSPIRHLKDGFEANQLSKSRMIVAMQNTLCKYDNCDYFPAYEIMMDDLRDYRFYEPNLTHPNQLAVDYIWEKFKKSYLNNETQLIIEAIKKINQAFAHKPRNPNSAKHKEFLRKQLETIKDLKFKYPYLDFSEDEKIFLAQLK